jgi:hypothetical protein
MDLMFYRSFIICHFIDRASRWHAGQLVDNKEDHTLFEALVTSWVGTHGPMKQLCVDGESGVCASAWFKDELKARQIELKPRAPGQHARYIERRTALLRKQLHAMEDQLIREGVKVPMKTLLAEAICAGNCLTYVGGVTPYQVVYGRQPSFLPPLMITAAMETRSVAQTTELKLVSEKSHFNR